MKICTLCFGNINRSPLAEAVLKNLSQEYNLNLEVISRGTSDYNTNKRANKTMRDLGALRGYDLENHRAKQIQWEDVESSDYIICMEPNNKNKLLQIYPETPLNKIIMLGDFISSASKVPDPHFAKKEQKEQIFNECIDMIVEGVSSVINKIRNNEKLTKDETNGGMFEW